MDQLRGNGRHATTTPYPPRRPPMAFAPRFDEGADGDSSDDQFEDSSRRQSTAVEAAGDGRIAEQVMASLLAHHRSALDYVRSVQFSNLRAGHEARRTAQALDALRREGVPLHFEGMEILVRNLCGVVEADKHGDPSLLEGLEWALPQDIVPRSVLRTVMKDAKRRNQLKPKSAPRDPKKGGPRGAAGK